MGLLGLPFEVTPLRYEEQPPVEHPSCAGGAPGAGEGRRSRAAAAGRIVIADTTVVLSVEQLGKPADAAAARAMLAALERPGAPG